MEVAVDTEGIAHVSATLDLPSDPRTVWGILTDYEHWPSLWSGGMTVVAIRSEPDGVVTDLLVPRIWLPGTLRLVIVTQTGTTDRIETRLVDGDFDRFWRVWVLIPIQEGRRTRARLQMDVRPKAWIPAWAFSYLLRQQLQDHLERLRLAVERRG